MRRPPSPPGPWARSPTRSTPSIPPEVAALPLSLLTTTAFVIIENLHRPALWGCTCLVLAPIWRRFQSVPNLGPPVKGVKHRSRRQIARHSTRGVLCERLMLVAVQKCRGRRPPRRPQRTGGGSWRITRSGLGPAWPSALSCRAAAPLSTSTTSPLLCRCTALPDWHIFFVWMLCYLLAWGTVLDTNSV